MILSTTTPNFYAISILHFNFSLPFVRKIVRIYDQSHLSDSLSVISSQVQENVSKQIGSNISISSALQITHEFWQILNSIVGQSCEQFSWSNSQLFEMDLSRTNSFLLLPQQRSSSFISLLLVYSFVA